MRNLAILILLTSTFSCVGQYQFDNAKISRQTRQVVSRIRKVNKLMGGAVYYSGIRPQQYDNFVRLCKKATTKELIELTNHPNGVVRCYSFWALSYRDSVNLLPIIITHISDVETVNTQFGCIGGREKVGDFFISIVTPQYVDLKLKKLTQYEFEYLDSLLIYIPNGLSSTENAIDKTNLSEAVYRRVRELVLNENNQTALVKLANFRREQDIPLILRNKQNGERYNQLYFTYKAISEFPHNSFLPLLRESLFKAIDEGAWSTEWSELYNAIASYKNDTALQLLKVPFTQVKYPNIRKYHIDFVFDAVQKFYTPLYDELLWQLWEDEKTITPELFSLLYLKDNNRALLLIKKKALENADDIMLYNSTRVQAP